jgi:predicted nucleotidyltransferase
MEVNLETIEKLTKYFENHEMVQMAFLFGSAAKGREIAESDKDIAVWLKDKYTFEEVSKIWSDLENLLHCSVDLIVLNQARPTIAWSALRGESLVIKNSQLYFSKLLEISREAEDMQDFIIDLFRRREKVRGSKI